MNHPSIYPRLLGSVEALLGALEIRDAYSRFHCDRVVRLATELGDECGVLDGELDLLRISARFHDIGKIGIPDAILLKPARLTNNEWETMKSHSELGEHIIIDASFPDNDGVATVIRHHHESFDGSGYPDGLIGDNIPLLSRIHLIVDAYDAMSTSRPYQKARSHAQIMEILDSENGKKFDPQIFNRFSKMIEHCPARIQDTNSARTTKLSMASHHA